MNTFSKNFATILFTVLLIPVFAQQDRKQEIKEKVNAQKVAFITDKLDLTEAEAQKFWPIYNAYQSELKAVRKDNNPVIKDDITDKEAEDMMRQILDDKKSEIDIQRAYISNFRTAIPPRKIINLFRAEKEFKEKVISNMKSRREGKGLRNK